MIDVLSRKTLVRVGIKPMNSMHHGQLTHYRHALSRLMLPVILTAWFAAGLPPTALGGGGPENVLLVVNTQSAASLSIANHYIQLRHIPAANVLYLPWDPKKDTTDVDTFRRQILTPVLKAVQSRSANRQIDCVLYSSDFPWAIDLEADVKKYLDANSGEADPKADDSDDTPGSAQWPKHLTPVGSLNGLTYLWQPVLLGNAAGYMSLNTNWYMRRAVPEQEEAPTLAFSSSYRFGPHGELVDSAGRTYLLSMMLGVTTGRGNTVEEVLDYLQRSASADGTHPQGTVYFVRNSDVRSHTRDWGYPWVKEQLEELGVAAEILEGTVPRNKDDVQGTMLGTANFDWKASGSTILPGAICDHFTSFGGVMRTGAGQTPFSEFLRHGAAGSNGTVAEPYSIAEKFPLASVHIHYARGCSLVEAYYQSIFAPYQLLVVGDPLCRPWANIPKVSVEGVEPHSTVKGTLTLKPSATVAAGSDVDHFELFVDGARKARCTPGQSFRLDTSRWADGYHELRLVAFESGTIRSQGRWIAPITTANHGRTIEMTVTPKAAADKRLMVSVNAPGAISFIVLQNTRLLGRVNQQQGQIEIDADTLGAGPVRLHAVGFGTSGAKTDVVSAPVELTVK